ncbi:MAG: sulfatase-like hydrolase/transferase [Planctomycetaceae bacterium]|nr:sulfatase-like hydrolase/transferase [Planctomycetaceae bacterium]
MTSPGSSDAAAAANGPSGHVAPGLWTSVFHLFILNGFVVAQPLLDQLQDNSPYIVEQRLTAGGLLAIAACLMFGLPVVLSSGEILTHWLSPARRLLLHGCCVMGFCLLQGGLMSRSLCDSDWLDLSGLSDLVQAAVAILAGGGLSWCYFRTPWGARLVSWAGIGLVIFPAAFVTSPGVLPILHPPPSTQKPLGLRQPLPIVLVVYDGLAGNTLLDEDRRIDAIRYPNFARLAGCSTWFRRATTVHPRTSNAVPAILSGRFPGRFEQPVLASYPQNLFTLLRSSGQYGFTIFEPFTRLSPPELQIPTEPRSVWRQTWDTLCCLEIVYWRISLPKNFSSSMWPIPRVWFSLPESLRIDRKQRDGVMEYSWDQDRRTQVRHFVDTLGPRPEPHLWFAHFGLPHAPFCYYPSGDAYALDDVATQDLPGTLGELGEDWGGDELAVDQGWQRYLLQVGFADRALGEILDRLQETSVFEDCLLIVTADHGYSFRRNRPMRTPTPETLPDIMPVPFFVKLPRQSEGRISDRNVESIDVLPTIADVIGMDLPLPVDGESVLAATQARLRKTLITADGSIGIAADFPQADESRQRMIARFGTGRADRLWTLDVRPELVGRMVSEFRVGTQPARELSYPLDYYSGMASSEEPFNGQLLRGELFDPAPATVPVVLAVVADGKILAVTRTYLEADDNRRWSVLLPQHALPRGLDSITFYEVLDIEGHVELRPCRTGRN